MTAIVERSVDHAELPTPSDGEVPLMTATQPIQLPMNSPKLCSTTNGQTEDQAFQLSRDFAYQPRKVKVFTIGAGFSGLIMAHKFQHRFPDMHDIVEHTIFEARSDVGGTWLVNNYPGVQCDVPAHIYVRIVQFYSSALMSFY